MNKLESCPYYIDCECYDPDHLIVIWPDTEEAGFEALFFEMRLHNYRNFWTRLMVGIKYIFKIGNCKSHEHFCSTSLNKDRVIKIRDLFNLFIEVCQDNWSKLNEKK